MKIRLLYKWDTRVGTFYVGQTMDGKYHPVFNDDSLGGYPEAWQAVEDLAKGATYSVSGVPGTSLLGIPEDLADWERL